MFILISILSIAQATNLKKISNWEYSKPKSIDICENASFLKEEVVDALNYWSRYVDTKNIKIN